MLFSPFLTFSLSLPSIFVRRFVGFNFSSFFSLLLSLSAVSQFCSATIWYSKVKVITPAAAAAKAKGLIWKRERVGEEKYIGETYLASLVFVRLNCLSPSRTETCWLMAFLCFFSFFSTCGLGRIRRKRECKIQKGEAIFFVSSIRIRLSVSRACCPGQLSPSSNS